MGKQVFEEKWTNEQPWGRMLCNNSCKILKTSSRARVLGSLRDQSSWCGNSSRVLGSWHLLLTKSARAMGGPGDLSTKEEPCADNAVPWAEVSHFCLPLSLMVHLHQSLLLSQCWILILARKLLFFLNNRALRVYGSEQMCGRTDQARV